MKKIYATPQTIVTVLKMQHHLLTGSAIGRSVYDTDADSGVKGFSRRSSAWDDDEEDE